MLQPVHDRWIRLLRLHTGRIKAALDDSFKRPDRPSIDYGVADEELQELERAIKTIRTITRLERREAP